MQTKLVMVLRDDLPTGLAVNAAAVLALSLGDELAGWLGADGKDADGNLHPGLNTHPVPILTASGGELRELNDAAPDDVRVVGFTEVARRAREYGEYLRTLAETPAAEIDYVGLVVFGPKAPVSKLTRRLALMR
uniref:DUF2000 domain-containing protein n=1 Tax=Herbidospora sakaeratensis TaxID=564415 RepID=UPI0007827DE8|nr:DUF2000 domain-containing protein [Herbidospora sakaeratensis]